MLLCIFALMALPVVARAPGEFSPPSRTFLFTYQVTLKDIPAGAQRVRVWIPLRRHRCESDRGFKES